MRAFEGIKEKLRNYLMFKPAQGQKVVIAEAIDHNMNACKNRVWYRGDPYELQQLYGQLPGQRTSFWGAVCTPGLEIRKIHLGMPGMMVEKLADIVVTDMEKIDAGAKQEIWDAIEEENRFNELVGMAVVDTLVTGDGAFKISINTELSPYPILDFYAGDKVEYTITGKQVRECIFKTVYVEGSTEYTLLEIYGHGYIKNKLMQDGKEVPLYRLKETEGLLQEITWENKKMLAVPMKFRESPKYQGRGKSIFDGKEAAFDALDESFSQWMDALRANRTREYIPDSLVPRNPSNGAPLRPNAFDNRFITYDADMNEGAKNTIEIKQGEIPHDSYLATYITALDVALQGVISPSTLGIDVKKLDNAEAQREKEKTTLYTRDKILDTLPGVIEELVNASVAAYETLNGSSSYTDVAVIVPFGEYANPSFESQVETVSKANNNGIMSIEQSIEELYGDTRDEEWKAEEVARIKAQRGIITVDELSLADVNQYPAKGQEEVEEDQ